MKQLVLTFLCFYYFSGTFFLPEGDFSAMTELSEMYHHCQATEDKDMNPLDFITDHLFNIDSVFDAHEGNDDQKPHHYTLHSHIVSFISREIYLCLPPIFQDLEDRPIFIYTSPYISTDYVCRVFRPPIV
jgi:hypothetical protein